MKLGMLLNCDWGESAWLVLEFYVLNHELGFDAIRRHQVRFGKEK